MLINADTFLSLLQVYRICWIKGRFGGGKSALAYKLAYDLVKIGAVDHVASNIQDVFSTPLEEIKLDQYDRLNVCIIADEAGLFLKFSKDAEEYLTLLRKLNVVLICPSVLPPTQRIRFFSVQRMMNLQRIGLPAWAYRWDLNYGGEREKEWFVWWQPAEIFGCYDTKSPPVDDAGIGSWLSDQKEIMARKLGYKRKSRRVIGLEDSAGPAGEVSDQNVDGSGGETGSAFLEAAETFSESIDALAIYGSRVGKRRR